MNKDEILNNFHEVAEELNNKSLPDSYWEKEEKTLADIQKENERIRKALQMSPEKWVKPFDL